MGWRTYTQGAGTQDATAVFAAWAASRSEGGPRAGGLRCVTLRSTRVHHATSRWKELKGSPQSFFSITPPPHPKGFDLASTRRTPASPLPASPLLRLSLASPSQALFPIPLNLQSTSCDLASTPNKKWWFWVAGEWVGDEGRSVDACPHGCDGDAWVRGDGPPPHHTHTLRPCAHCQLPTA